MSVSTSRPAMAVTPDPSKASRTASRVQPPLCSVRQTPSSPISEALAARSSGVRPLSPLP